MSTVRVRYDELRAGVRLMRAGPEVGALELLCLPCAGGTAASFKPLFGALPASWRLSALEPPGHGFNAGVPLESIDVMVDIYLEALAPELERRPFLVGHSLGGILAFLIQRRLEASGRTTAGIVIGAARHPPGVVDEAWSTFSDADLIGRLDRIGGVPEVFRGRPADFAAYLPAVRADFRALEAFAARDWDPTPVTCRTAVVVAGADPFAPMSKVERWLDFALDAELHVVPGDHFFVQSAVTPFAALLRSVLPAWAGA